MPGHGQLLDYISELGYVSVSGLGPTPLSFQDIYYWSKLCGLSLSGWEVMALRKISAAYLDQTEKAKAALCPPPWQAETVATPEVRQKVEGFFKKFVQEHDQRKPALISGENVKQ